MADPILSLNGITKRFGGVVALENVSFDVGENEIVGLMGPNGAGKTTLLSTIDGTLAPDSGVIRYKGRKITGLPPYKTCKLGIGRTFQIPQPFVTLSVFDNLRVAAVFGQGRCRKAGSLNLDYILELAGLEERKHQLAGGLPILSLKKLELARALACDCQLVLLDEIAAGLTDPEIPQVLETIEKIRSMGKAIIIVEHVMKVLTNAVDRIVVLDKGCVLCGGSTDEVMCDARVVEAYFGT